MAGDAACAGVGHVVVAHYEAVDGEGIPARGDLQCEGVDDVVDGLLPGVVYLLSLYGLEAQAVEPCHALSPRRHVAVGVYQCEGQPLQVAVHDVLRVFDAERARGQVTRIGIVFARLDEIAFEVVVGYDGLAAYDKVSPCVDAFRDALDGLCQVSDVGSYVSVAACHHLCQPAVVVGHHEGQSVQFPRYPYRASVGPLGQFGGLLGLGQRQGGVLVGLLQTLRIVFADTLCGRVGQGGAGLCLQPPQLVETLVPFVVGHALGASVVVGL